MLKQKKRTPDWGKLHSALQNVYSAAGAVRMRAAVDSHSDKKELICRRLGVVSMADVSRISAHLASRPKI
jgi:hypothetical protein